MTVVMKSTYVIKLQSSFLMLFHMELSKELNLKRFVRPNKLNSHLPRLIIMAMIIIQIVSVNFHPH